MEFILIYSLNQLALLVFKCWLKKSGLWSHDEGVMSLSAAQTYLWKFLGIQDISGKFAQISLRINYELC